MVQSKIIQSSSKELSNLITKVLKTQLIKFLVNPKVKNLTFIGCPTITRKATTNFFDVSHNYINYCSKNEILKSLKVSEKTCYKKSNLLDTVFT